MRAIATVLGIAFLLWTAVSGGGRAAEIEAQREPGRYAPATDRPIPSDKVAATFAFDPAVAPQDRQAIETAIAGARPEAQQLIARVDGLTSISVGPLRQAAGTTRGLGDGYAVELDLGPVAQHLGTRGISRVVLHELAHVIDFAILPDALRETLDAGVPDGWGCEQGRSGACAVREERFAESFAKWAMNDIGVDLFIGYKVPPPGPTLDAWGAPLAQLAASR
ncbi:MAG TPA: hypothetical protein VF533_00455 [Solirubrobacteraceae bacterium]